MNCFDPSHAHRSEKAVNMTEAVTRLARVARYLKETAMDVEDMTLESELVLSEEALRDRGGSC